MLELGEDFVRVDELASVGLRDAALERAVESGALVSAHGIGRAVVQVHADLGAIGQIDGLVYDNPAVYDVGL